jgi:hypothetical protein
MYICICGSGMLVKYVKECVNYQKVNMSRISELEAIGEPVIDNRLAIILNGVKLILDGAPNIEITPLGATIIL